MRVDPDFSVRSERTPFSGVPELTLARSSLTMQTNDFLPAVLPQLLSRSHQMWCFWRHHALSPVRFFVLVLHRHNDEQFVRGILKIVWITGGGEYRLGTVSLMQSKWEQHGPRWWLDWYIEAFAHYASHSNKGAIGKSDEFRFTCLCQRKNWSVLERSRTNVAISKSEWRSQWLANTENLYIRLILV